MKIVDAGYQIVTPTSGGDKLAAYRAIVDAARTCYKSEGDGSFDSAAKMIRKLIGRGHEAMLEHASMTVRFFVDRGLTHELVRHRIASFAQSSTRYCNYADGRFGGEIRVINLMGGLNELERQGRTWKEAKEDALAEWRAAMEGAERHYMRMIDLGCPAEIARSVLPTSTAAELVVTANMREWRTILNLRAAGTTGKPHPQMLEVTVPLLRQLNEYMPELFGDIAAKLNVK